ncbi:MAG: glycosyltransferase family 2 protein [Clostridia bacterium]|nr:glycosyltransferase family 2 protein [Clostridia bacterium]
MKFSVIVPAYNSAAFLPQALDSLLSQTAGDFEVVVVNDGSTDNTQEVLDAYIQKDPRVRSLRQENAGVSAARNNGLLAAGGDYVTFLDADDWYAPDTLKAFTAAAEKSGADLLLGRLQMVEDGRPAFFHEMADVLAKEETVGTFDSRLLWNFLVSNKCYRRAFLLEHDVRFPATGFSEEGAFFMDAVYAGASMAGAPESIVYYRRHTAGEGLSVSQTASEKNLQSLEGSMRHIYDAAAAVSADGDYLQEILYKHLHILVSQFYRELWRMTDEALALCVGQMDALLQKLTPARLNAICGANPDLDLRRLRRDKADAAARPRSGV